jgi:hypothetical protein
MFKLTKFLLPTLVLSSLLIGYQQEVNGVDLKHQQEAKRNNIEDKKEVKKTEEVVFNIKKIEDDGLEVKYPVFKGEAFKDINDFINKEVKKFVNDYKEEKKLAKELAKDGIPYIIDFYLDIKPHIIDKEVINLKESIYVNAGGAHGDSAESWIVFVKDENQKKYVQIKLSDVVNLDKKCEKDLRQTIYKKLKKQGAYYPDLKLLENFYLDKKGIVFVFNPESIGLSRYDEISLVKIPYSFPCVKKDGITKKFLD